ncbi:MAG: IS66 family transposase [Eubacteriales bacterium]
MSKQVTNLENKVQKLQENLVEKDARIDKLENQIEKLTQMLLNAQNARFGQSSEKEKYTLPEQFNFLNEAEIEQNPKEIEPPLEEIVKEYIKKPRRTHEEWLKTLPVKEVIMDLTAEQKICECGTELTFIGKKFVRKELQYIPASLKVIHYYYNAYICRTCQENEVKNCVTYPEVSPGLMKHSLASPSAVANVMTQKYVDGLPLHRQEKIWKRLGIDLSRSTLANWVIQCADRYLKPVYTHMKHRLLESKVIYADETVVQVLKEDGKPATSQSRMWVYGSDGRSGKPIRIFEYQPDRSGKHPENFLRGFSGCLVTDGYAGYNKVENVTRFGCWAHMKRKWKEAMPKGATVENSKAAVGFQMCNKLFRLEKNIKDLKSNLRKEARQGKILIFLDEYFLWIKNLNTTSGSKLAEAVTYAKNQEAMLREFVNFGEVEISNNFAENAIRPFVVGRKNWLFCDSVKGAKSSAIIYSIVETAVANGRNPAKYLEFLLTEVPYLEKTPSAEDLESLMPWNMRFEADAVDG